MNRVFESSGPEGKVRGTPQQIIDKYNQLVRDAQLGNDRVAAENFQQHAEHYLRLLAEAQREQDARRDQQQQQNQNTAQPAASQPDHDAEKPADQAQDKPFEAVMDGGANTDAGLVETPEQAPKPARAPRSRKPKPAPKPKPQDQMIFVTEGETVVVEDPPQGTVSD